MGIYALNKDKRKLKRYAPPIDQAVPKSKVKRKPSAFVEKAATFSKNSLMLLASGFIFFVASLMLLIASRANFVTQNKELENLQLELSDIQEDEMHTEQEVNELSNYDRVIKIAEENGLEVHEDNIRNVNR